MRDGRSEPEGPRLRAEHLIVGYGKPLIAPFSGGVSPGELVILLGSNGSGKSTLMRTLAGLHAPVNGHVEVGDATLACLSAACRAKRLALVTSGRPRVPLPVREIVALGRVPYTGWSGRLTREDLDLVHRALEMTGAAEHADRPFESLSDGEAQRVLIARALAQESPFLLLDEPVAHLDVTARLEILALLRGLVRDEEARRGIVVSMHDLDLAFRMADRVWLLADGELRAGAPEDLVLQGVIERAFSRPGLVFVPEDASFRSRGESGCSVRVVGEGLAAEWTRRALIRAGLEPVSEEAEGARATVGCEEPLTWRSSVDGREQTHTSIEGLLVELLASLANG